MKRRRGTGNFLNSEIEKTGSFFPINRFFKSIFISSLRKYFHRMRDEMFRRGGIRLPGIPPHDPYLEASRRYGAPGLQSPYSRKYNELKVCKKDFLLGQG